MQVLLTRRCGRTVAFATLVLTACTASGFVKAQDAEKPVAQKSDGKAAVKQPILVFPPDTQPGKGDQLSEDILGVIRRRLGEGDKYEVVQFSRRNPVLRRAETERTVRPEDVEPPYGVANTKVRRLARLLGQKRALVSSVDSYEYNKMAGQVSLVMSARLIEIDGDAIKVVKSVSESMTGPKTGMPDAPELKIARDAVRDLTENVMKEILAPPKPAEAKPEEKKPN